MKIFEDYIRDERQILIEQKTRLLHSGRLDRIPSSLATLLRDVQDETKNFSDFTLHLALDYSGKDEMMRAIKKIMQSEKRNTVDERSFSGFLDQPDLPEIDLIVRTSGEMRTSNFFLWQTVYSEWLFLEKYFPELTTDDLSSALEEFDERKRRFGS